MTRVSLSTIKTVNCEGIGAMREYIVIFCSYLRQQSVLLAPHGPRKLKNKCKMAESEAI